VNRVSDGLKPGAGSAAKAHEQTGGNVQAGKMPLPAGGDAARRAENEGDLINEAHGIRTAPRGEYRKSMQLNLPRVVGARMVDAAAPPPDLSGRKASDYLPPALKAQLIAQGKLAPEGSPASSLDAGGAVETPSASSAAAPAGTSPQPAAPLPLAKRILGKLFGLFGK
jgi:hypothetical protein